MLQLTEIELVQFRNYTQQKITFQERIVAICGLNGTGKTNLLDAIHYLCLTKSAFSNTDSQHIRQGEQFFMLQGNFEKSPHNYIIDCNFAVYHSLEFYETR